MECQVKGINNNTIENKPVKYRFVLNTNNNKNNTIENKPVKYRFVLSIDNNKKNTIETQ